jgi:epoxyqueuosine reductase
VKSATEKPKLLLHICCAPCAVYVVQELSAAYDVTGFFYNPNIQPEAEYLFRMTELQRVAKSDGWNILYGEYDPEKWDEAVKGLEDEPERGKRCSVCFCHRLRETFRIATEKQFDFVASTLSISPYKKTAQINREGEDLAREFGIPFLSENFKKQDGYAKARKLAHDKNIRHQDYCGCLFSKEDRQKRLAEKKAP